MEYIAWPIAAIIIAVLFMLFFKRPIIAFLNRVKSVGKGGVSTDTSQEVQSAGQQNKVIQDLMSVGDSITVKELEKAILDNLSSKGLETTSQTAEILSRHLAYTQLALEFEQVYQTIFGSQITLLKKINQYREGGRNKEFINDYFSNVKLTFPEFKDWDTDKYLFFLFDRQLITMVSGKYHITNRGVDFLGWLVKSGKDEGKYL